MKCTSCGMPLSPSRAATQCPRCGAPLALGNGQRATANIAQGSASWGSAGGAPFQAPSPANYQPQSAPGAIYPTPGGMETNGTPGQVWLPRPDTPSGAPFYHPQPGSPSPFPQPPQPPTGRHNARIGFIAAGLCVFAGGLLLVFVYFMAIGLPGNGANTSITPTIPGGHTPTVIPSPSNTPVSTATVYPGQQYIDTVQLSSAAPSSTQPVQPVTSAKVNQKIYVTFHIHPGGKSGAVCFAWYLNGQHAFDAQIPVSPSSKSSYVYGIYGSPGQARVDLYWASSGSCTDKVLAQSISFPVAS